VLLSPEPGDLVDMKIRGTRFNQVFVGGLPHHDRIDVLQGRPDGRPRADDNTMLTGKNLKKCPIACGVALFCTEHGKPVLAHSFLQLFLQPGQMLMVGHDDEDVLLCRGQPLCGVCENTHSVPASVSRGQGHHVVPVMAGGK
jgi:hypothetical protein